MNPVMIPAKKGCKCVLSPGVDFKSGITRLTMSVHFRYSRYIFRGIKRIQHKKGRIQLELIWMCDSDFN